VVALRQPLPHATREAGRDLERRDPGRHRHRPDVSTTGGTSDGRFVAEICPEVVEFGPVNASIHKINENIDLPAIESLRKIYFGLLERPSRILTRSPFPTRIAAARPGTLGAWLSYAERRFRAARCSSATERRARETKRGGC